MQPTQQKPESSNLESLGVARRIDFEQILFIQIDRAARMLGESKQDGPWMGNWAVAALDAYIEPYKDEEYERRVDTVREWGAKLEQEHPTKNYDHAITREKFKIIMQLLARKGVLVEKRNRSEVTLP